MSFLACFYLFRRRFSLFLIILFGFGYGFLLLELFITEGEVGFVGIAVLVPYITGMRVGSTFGETMHRPFTWTLPGWRRRLGAWALIIGIAAASLSTAAVPWLGRLQSVFPLMLLFYFIGLYLGNSLVAPGRRFIIHIILVLSGPLLFLLFHDEVVASGLSHPALTLAAMVIVCPVILYSVLNVRSVRKRLLAPVDLSSQEGQRRWRMQWARDVEDAWKEEFLGDGIVNWLRAGRYEMSGWVGNGWPSSSLFVSVLIVLVVLLIGYVAGLELGNDALVHFAVTLTGSPPMETLLLMGVSVFVWIGFLCGTMPLFSLRKGAFYPLSRLQLAHLTYAGSLFQALSFTLMLGACFVAAGAFVGLFSGEGYSLEDSSGILGLIAWSPVYAPLMQWVHHTMVDSKNQFRMAAGRLFPARRFPLGLCLDLPSTSYRGNRGLDVRCARCPVHSPAGRILLRPEAILRTGRSQLISGDVARSSFQFADPAGDGVAAFFESDGAPAPGVPRLRCTQSVHPGQESLSRGTSSGRKD